MGFYLRKSFRAGPIRFNLSKSGIGVSAGVTGARLGVSSTGRAYVHGGRGGLYYRQSLGSGSGLRRSGAAGDIAQRRAASRAPIELTANRRDGRDVRQPGAAGGDRPIRGADTARIEIRLDRAVPRRRVTPTAACSTSGSGPPIPSLTMYRQKSTPRERVAGSYRRTPASWSKGRTRGSSRRGWQPGGQTRPIWSVCLQPNRFSPWIRSSYGERSSMPTAGRMSARPRTAPGAQILPQERIRCQ